MDISAEDGTYTCSFEQFLFESTVEPLWTLCGENKRDLAALVQKKMIDSFIFWLMSTVSFCSSYTLYSVLTM